MLLRSVRLALRCGTGVEMRRLPAAVMDAAVVGKPDRELGETVGRVNCASSA